MFSRMRWGATSFRGKKMQLRFPTDFTAGQPSDDGTLWYANGSSQMLTITLSQIKNFVAPTNTSVSLSQLPQLPLTQVVGTQNGLIISAQIASLDASKVTGTLNASTLPSIPIASIAGTSNGQLADSQIASLSAIKLQGTIPQVNLPSAPSFQLVNLSAVPQYNSGNIGDMYDAGGLLRYSTIALDEALRPEHHVSPPTRWMNDIQRPVYSGGEWHIWYLWNGDYPTGNGTEWRHSVSQDLVNWTDKGVSIPKYKQGMGDPWTGSTVIDTNNTAGFGAGAVVALVTMAGDAVGGQTTFLWYSTDNGYSFTYYGQVMGANPYKASVGSGDPIFRDPSVFWDADRGRWHMSLAEVGKIGFYHSADLKNWIYSGGFNIDAGQNMGTAECPNLLLVPYTKGTRWVLFVGANGFSSGQTTGIYYWIGGFDGSSFTPDSTTPKRLDAGPDYYAGVMWAAGNGLVYSCAWMNNWAYAGKMPTNNFKGCMSSIREVSLTDDGMTARCIPAAAWPAKYPVSQLGTDQIIGGNVPFVFPKGTPKSHMMTCEFVQQGGAWPSMITLDTHSNGTQFMRYLINPTAGTVTQQRGSSGDAISTDPAWTTDRVTNFTAGTQFKIKLISDRQSSEMFINDGTACLSCILFPSDGQVGKHLTATGGSVLVSGLEVLS
jgi:levanase